MSLFAKARKVKENKKGFTLVELIVVLVILAILAAILVPALLGWIDEAKKKQYVLEARSIYTAAQAVADEGFAADVLDAAGAPANLKAYLSNKDQLARIATLSDVGTIETGTDGKVTGVKGLSFTKIGVKDADDPHGKYTIEKMAVSFKSASDGTTYVGATLNNGTWTVKTGTSEVTPDEWTDPEP